MHMYMYMYKGKYHGPRKPNNPSPRTRKPRPKPLRQILNLEPGALTPTHKKLNPKLLLNPFKTLDLKSQNPKP